MQDEYDALYLDAAAFGKRMVAIILVLAVIITLAAIAYGHAITRAEAVALGCSDYPRGEYAACLEERK